MSFSGFTGNSSSLILPGSGFWPDLAVAEFQRLYRMPAEYADELLLDHLALARSWAVRLLAAWAAGRQADGYQTLGEVPFAGLPGAESLRIFKEAVFCRAKALLLPQFATADRREAARNEAREAPETADVFYARSNDAIADLLGEGRIMVASI